MIHEYKSDDRFEIPRGIVYVIRVAQDAIIKRGEQIKINDEEYTIKDLEIFRGWPDYHEGQLQKIGILV